MRRTNNVRQYREVHLYVHFSKFAVPCDGISMVATIDAHHVSDRTIELCHERRAMAGPNLEVFKFAVYVFFPVLVFLHYGDPEWYRTNVIPYKERLFPSDDRTARSSSMPTNHAAVRQELERIKAEKAALRAQREHAAKEDPSSSEGFKKLV